MGKIFPEICWYCRTKLKTHTDRWLHKNLDFLTTAAHQAVAVKYFWCKNVFDLYEKTHFFLPLLIFLRNLFSTNFLPQSPTCFLDSVRVGWCRNVWKIYLDGDSCFQEPLQTKHETFRPSQFGTFPPHDLHYWAWSTHHLMQFWHLSFHFLHNLSNTGEWVRSV